jgi:signal transduction histidine kinase/ligand-binding sensor domain-containing protein
MRIPPPNRKPRFQALWTIPLLLCLSAPLQAQEYGLDFWTTANGLPQNTVTGVVQTPDGYLWVSTFDGLARFDGVRFTIFDKGNTRGIVNNRFASLHADPTGVLFAVTEDNVVTVYRNGSFVSYTQFAVSGEQVFPMVGDAKGSIVFETDKGYYSLQGNQFVLTAEQRVANVKLSYWGKSGAKWILERNQVTRFRDGQSTSYAVSLSAEELRGLSGLTPYEDQHGALWLRRRSWPIYELVRLKDGKVRAFTKTEIPAFTSLQPSQVREESDGSISFLLIDTTLKKPSVIIRFRDEQFTVHQLPRPLGVTTSVIDRENNFWLATSHGLARLKRKLISTLSVSDGLNNNEVYPLIQTTGGDIFVGTAQGVSRFTGGKLSQVGVTYSNGSPLYMRGMWEDNQGRLWLGYQGEGGFGRFENPDSLKRIGKRDLPTGATDFASDREGSVWVATDEGLFKYKDDQEIAHYSAKDGLPSGRVITVHVDRHGNLWVGTFDGVAQLKSGAFISYNAEAGSPKGFVRAIYEDADGVLWFGTYGDGLVRYKDGKFFNYRVEHGLFNNGVFAILEDKRGNFWMSSNRGIHRVSKQELSDFADGRIPKLNSVSYDEKDGMLNAECNGGRLPAAIQAKDGKLWFPTMGGVAIVDPEAETVNPTSPSVVIENISIDRKPFDLSASPNQVVLQPGQSNIAIEYTGLSLIKSEQIKFKYKLEGLEADWVEAGTRRTVDYSYLPAGTYTFRLIAANANGVWNNQGTLLKIVVRPFFYQTWWFIGLLALALATFVWWLYYTRVSRLRAIAEAKTLFSRQLIESQENERKRIASELHDGLGQSLVIIKNRATLGLNKGGDQERVARELGSISESATQALEEVREITNNLRPQLLDRLGLTKAIQSMLKKVAGVIEVECQIGAVDGIFSDYQEISIYRIVQEAVNNIIKHSSASHASVEITRGSNDVSIVIRDNGKGFDMTVVDPERRTLGLVGLTERAQLLKGEIVIESKPGAGTVIRVTIPVSKAR